ncbi:uncharacterized protein LOC118559372 [Fundulus heteroclitus]|uniref:uncharacterized protein LOC118559372 n=1 Tax=Fundulus heteroclitus TaxID=8078 RepID=UPI00165A2E6A|nr:uncharacterized protein LOC118559372 [Fundulus heteroclitus]
MSKAWWPTIFKQKVIQQSKTLPTSSDLELIYCAEGASNEKELKNLASGWDTDLAFIILLLHLIPPSCQGCKRPGKVSASQAEKHLVVFQKSGTSIQQHVDAITSTIKPLSSCFLVGLLSLYNSMGKCWVTNVTLCTCKSIYGSYITLSKDTTVQAYEEFLHDLTSCKSSANAPHLAVAAGVGAHTNKAPLQTRVVPNLLRFCYLAGL